LLSEKHQGSLAELVTVPTANLLAKPAELSFGQAACLPAAWLTAYRMLFVNAGLRPGDTVLIQGGTGGVSTAAIALARAGGFEVFVTARTEAKQATALHLGAHQAFPTGGRLPRRVDAVIDSVGAVTWSHSLKSLRPGGRLVICGATTGGMPPADLNRIFFRQLAVIGTTTGTREELVALVNMLLVTGVRPVIDRVLPLAEAADGLAALAAGEVVGKVIIEP